MGRWALLVGLICGLSVGARAADEVQLYRPQSRPATELAPLVQDILGPEGAALPDPGSGALLLRGSPADVRQALELLRQLDAPVRSFRVTTEVVSREEARSRGFGVEGWVQVGALRVARLRGGTEPAGVAVRLDTREISRSGQRRTEVVVVEGREARIATGHLFPVLVYRERHEPRGPAELLVSPTLMPVESGARVRVRGAGDGLLDVELEPFDAAVDRPSFAMATRVRMRPGETLAVGGIDRGRGTAGGGAFGYAERESTQDLVVLLHVAPVEGGP